MEKHTLYTYNKACLHMFCITQIIGTFFLHITKKLKKITFSTLVTGTPDVCEITQHTV